MKSDASFLFAAFAALLMSIAPASAFVGSTGRIGRVAMRSGMRVTRPSTSKVVGTYGPLVASMSKVDSSGSTTRTTQLHLASSEASMDEDVKNRLVTGHNLCTALFLAVVFGILYNAFGSSIGWGLPLYAASGPYLAAGVSTILSDAAENNRLGSGTYKTLSLFLTEFNLCGVATILLAWGGNTLRTNLFYALSLASFLSLSPTLAGYKNGGGNLFRETGNVVKGFFTFKNLNSLIYLAGTWFVASLKVLKLVDMINLYTEGNPAKVIVTRAVRFGRLALLTGVMFVLKDAAKRDRLEGSTFIDLNFLSAISLGTMANYIKTIRGGMTPLVYASAGFSAFTLLNALNSIRKKAKKD